MMIQYLGCQPTRDILTYSFRVVDSPDKQREFAMSIQNSLMNNYFKYQDAPDLCFSKLKHDLALENPDSPLPSQMKITDADLKKYTKDHYPAKRKLSRSLNLS
jgi:hypothetical protein